MQKGYEKIAMFGQYLALSRKWYKTELQLQWQTYVVYRMAPFSMTLNDR